jgi:hypothetical protein
MTRIGALSTTVLFFAVTAAPGLAQDSRYWREQSSSANIDTLRRNFGDTEIFGIRNSENTEPGDFAVTGGLSNQSREWNPTGQVDPGTSNSPAGNAGGE